LKVLKAVLLKPTALLTEKEIGRQIAAAQIGLATFVKTEENALRRKVVKDMTPLLARFEAFERSVIDITPKS